MTVFTQHIDIPVGGGTLHVGVAGPPDGATVIAAHGITANHLAWGRVARRVAQHARFVAADLRGRGASAGLPGPFGMRAHAEDLVAVLDHLGVDRAVVAGHSMGGFVAATLAATAPDRVAGAVLVDGGLPLPVPDGLDPDTVLDAVLGPAIARLRQEFASVDDYIAFWQAHPAFAQTGTWNDDLDAWVRADLTGAPPTLRSVVSEAAVRADGAEIIVDVEIRGMADRITAPTRFVRAPRGLFDEEGGLQPADVCEAFVERHANVTLTTVDDVNHYTLLFDDSAVAAIADAIVESVGR